MELCSALFLVVSLRHKIVEPRLIEMPDDHREAGPLAQRRIVYQRVSEGFNAKQLINVLRSPLLVSCSRTPLRMIEACEVEDDAPLSINVK